jgi:hypothetical protein
MSSVANGQGLLIQGAILLLAVVSLTLSWWAARAGSPVIALFGRWTRWMFLAALVAAAVRLFGWSGYGLPVLFIVSMLGIFVVETGYNWLAISALSRSDLPLFPKFNENERGEEWPSQPRFIQLKDRLRALGFKKRQALVSVLGDNILMRVSVFENAGQTIRMQVLLLPNPRGSTAVCFTLFSQTRDGGILITDNVFLPFGGFYPENWEVERRPWTRSIDKLLQRHHARIDARAEELIPFVTEPIEQINQDQRLIEQLNQDLGFLNKPAEEIEQGRLTPAGKARIWQEVWTLSYLGLPLPYS